MKRQARRDWVRSLGLGHAVRPAWPSASWRRARRRYGWQVTPTEARAQAADACRLALQRLYDVEDRNSIIECARDAIASGAVLEKK